MSGALTGRTADRLLTAAALVEARRGDERRTREALLYARAAALRAKSAKDRERANGQVCQAETAHRQAVEALRRAEAQLAAIRGERVA